MIDLCLSKCYFLWENKIYLLKNSAPIGLALMGVMAEAFLQHHKPNALRIALEQNTPKSFLCYVDDSHARFNTSDAPTKFQDILNEQHPSIIKYTTETEDVDKRLQFLDIDIHNNDGVYKYKIHRKNAIKNLQIKPHSGHDLKVLRGIFSGFLH